MAQTDAQVNSAVAGMFYRGIDGSVFILKALSGFQGGKAHIYFLENIKTGDGYRIDPYDFKYSFILIPKEELKTLQVLYGN